MNTAAIVIFILSFISLSHFWLTNGPTNDGSARPHSIISTTRNHSLSVTLSPHQSHSTHPVITVSHGITKPSLEKTRSTTTSTTTTTATTTTTTTTIILKPLPGLVDLFKWISEREKFFVDKTRFIRILFDFGYKLFTLKRPKYETSFLEMFLSFLEGRKDYFHGTSIFTKGNTVEADGTWKNFPVIYIDFASITKTETVKEFRGQLRKKLKQIRDFHGLPKRKYQTSMCILIRDLKEKYQLPVSIIIDNHEYPLVKGNFSQKELRRVEIILATFYKQIRECHDQLSLALVLGVSLFGLGIPGHYATLTYDSKRFSHVMDFTSEEIDNCSVLELPYASVYFKTNSALIVRRINYIYHGDFWINVYP